MTASRDGAELGVAFSTLRLDVAVDSVRFGVRPSVVAHIHGFHFTGKSCAFVATLAAFGFGMFVRRRHVGIPSFRESDQIVSRGEN